MQTYATPLILLTCTLLAACGKDGGPAPSGDNAMPPAAVSSAEKHREAGGSPGKPSAPIRFRYEVIGNPIVGQPVAVKVFVDSTITDRPINLQYRVNDPSSMAFPASQARRKEIVADSSGQQASEPQQITVVPQREGRLFLNVSAEIVMDDGDILLKNQAIPINVGPAPLELDENGELKETADGETVESLPST